MLFYWQSKENCAVCKQFHSIKIRFHLFHYYCCLLILSLNHIKDIFYLILISVLFQDFMFLNLNIPNFHFEFIHTIYLIVQFSHFIPFSEFIFCLSLL